MKKNSGGNKFTTKYSFTLADDLGQLVQVRVDGLKPEVGHANGVCVGVHERDPHASAPFLADDAFFARDEGLCFLLQPPGHTLSLARGAKAGPERDTKEIDPREA